MASLNPSEPAILKLISDESTEWYLPSKHSTRTSTTGKPCTPPCAIVSSMPFSTAGMNWRGMAPPTILSTNSKPAPRSSGSTRRQATPNWPWPPRLLLVLALGLGLAGDRLAVGDPDVLGVDVDAELALRAARGRRPGGSRPCPAAASGGSRRCARRTSAGSSSWSRWRAVRQLVLVGLGAGLDGDGQDRRAAARSAAPRTGVPLGASVSPVPVSASLATAAMSPAGDAR